MRTSSALSSSAVIVSGSLSSGSGVGEAGGEGDGVRAKIPRDLRAAMQGISESSL